MKTVLFITMVMAVSGIYAQAFYSDGNCRAFFKYEVNDKLMMPYAATAINFYDQSVGKVKEWYWDFGEGNTSREQNPMFIFKHPVSSPDVKINPYRNVRLTILTDSCKSSYTLTINILDGKPYIKPDCPYVIRIKSGFPVQLSSCTGWAQAQVYLNDSLVKAMDYKWSTGEEGEEVKSLCPASTYTVKARTPDGCVAACTFILNSDGTIKEIPVTWWVDGPRESLNIQYNLNNKSLTAEWKLPDGTIIKSDSIPLSSMNGGSEILDLIVRDSAGNIVYSEKIALKAFITGTFTNLPANKIILYPNPVTDLVHIDYSGRPLEELWISIIDLSGRILTERQIKNVASQQEVEIDVRLLKKGIYVCKMVLDHKDLIFSSFIK